MRRFLPVFLSTTSASLETALWSARGGAYCLGCGTACAEMQARGMSLPVHRLDSRLARRAAWAAHRHRTVGTHRRPKTPTARSEFILVHERDHAKFHHLANFDSKSQSQSSDARHANKSVELKNASGLCTRWSAASVCNRAM